MRTFLEAPVPFLFGINQDAQNQNLPLDVIRVNLDLNKVLIGEPLPKLPSYLHKLLFDGLKAAFNLQITGYDPILQAVDQAFNVILIDPDEQVEFNYMAIREVLLDFMLNILKGYQKFVVRIFIS